VRRTQDHAATGVTPLLEKIGHRIATRHERGQLQRRIRVAAMIRAVMARVLQNVAVPHPWRLAAREREIDRLVEGACVDTGDIRDLPVVGVGRVARERVEVGQCVGPSGAKCRPAKKRQAIRSRRAHR